MASQNLGTRQVDETTLNNGVALNAESLEDEIPVPVDDNLSFKDFKNPNPAVKIAQLTSFQ